MCSYTYTKTYTINTDAKHGPGESEYGDSINSKERTAEAKGSGSVSGGDRTRHMYFASESKEALPSSSEHKVIQATATAAATTARISVYCRRHTQTLCVATVTATATFR